MYEVRIEDSFAAAHFLRDYNGKCENLHGHNYKVFAHLRGSELNEGGMLFDFSQFKSIVHAVISQLDHTNLNDMVVFKQNPSAERIAKYIYDETLDLLRKCESYASHNVKLFCIEVYETEKNRARYIAD